MFDSLSDQVEYKICEYCGFRLMEVMVPKSRTQPFPEMHCSVCGFKRNKKGILPGRALTPEERVVGLASWLEQRGLTSQVL